jgi:hypothetical protein
MPAGMARAQAGEMQGGIEFGAIVDDDEKNPIFVGHADASSFLI